MSDETRQQKMCGCKPRHACYLHNGHSKQPTINRTANDCYLSFKSALCGYVGPATDCDKTIACCAKLGNQANWRGWSSLIKPSPVAPHDLAVVPSTPRKRELEGSWELPVQKVQCRICSCEGVEGTVLCRDHLEGYRYCCGLMPSKRAAMMLAAIQQKR